MSTLILSPKILLIENDPGAADGIRAALAATGSGSFDVEWVRQLSAGLERLSKRGIDAVLLALSLPDSQGLETFDKLFAAAPDIPILVCMWKENAPWSPSTRLATPFCAPTFPEISPISISLPRP